MSLKVLVADDNKVVRSSIVRILKQNPDVEVVGEAINYAQTMELTAALKPDVLLLDLLMPDEGDFTCCTTPAASWRFRFGTIRTPKNARKTSAPEP
jgi:DNA-binding NarL/FixJ family response regulator